MQTTSSGHVNSGFDNQQSKKIIAMKQGGEFLLSTDTIK